MKNYEVTLTATSCKTVTLSAESEKAAKKLWMSGEAASRRMSRTECS